MPKLSFFQDHTKIEFLRYFSRLLLPVSVSRALSAFLGIVERTTGFSLGIETPDTLARYDESLWDIIYKLEHLKKLGVINGYGEGWSFYYPDEPLRETWYSLIQDKKRGINTGGLGIDLFDKRKAFLKLFGESVERYSLCFYNPEIYEDGSYAKMREKNSINIFSVAGISEDVRRRGVSDFELNFDEKSLFRWVPGRSLTQEKKIWIPIQLVSFYQWFNDNYKREPLIIPSVSTGAAAHSSLDRALVNGILEIIERDAFMIYWVNTITPERIDENSIEDERIKHILKLCKRYRVDIHLCYLKTDVPTHTVLAVAKDATDKGPHIAVGANSDNDIAEAILGALYEALDVRIFVRKKIDTLYDGQEIPNISFEKSFLDRDARVLYWALDKSLAKEISFMISGKKLKLSEIPHYEIFNNDYLYLKYLLDYFKSNNYEVSFVDITTPPSIRKKLGVTVASLVIPEFQPLHLLESIPCFGGNRLSDIPKKLGLQTSGKINTTPHPFP
jgi:ribosomal protein S12 methylthiotransferase accessory factor